jgi:hypothetical protein
MAINLFSVVQPFFLWGSVRLLFALAKGKIQNSFLPLIEGNVHCFMWSALKGSPFA